MEELDAGTSIKAKIRVPKADSNALQLLLGFLCISLDYQEVQDFWPAKMK